MKRSFKQIIILTLASALMGVLASGCATVRGIGSDVSAVGAGIRNAAR